MARRCNCRHAWSIWTRWSSDQPSRSARRWRDGQVVAEEGYLLTSSQYFLHELELLLTQAGFGEITVSAGYSDEAVTAAHTFIVYTARKSALERQGRT